MASKQPSAIPEEIGSEIPLIEKAEAAIAQFENQIMSLPNVVGFGFGEKEDFPGMRVLQAFVTRKLPLSRLAIQEVIPERIEDFEVDVIEVGVIVAQSLTERMRPTTPGFSVGHTAVTAGTIGAGCYDLGETATINPPRHGITRPSRYYMLSNNHILANSNNARIGDPIVQPGPIDGGRLPQDLIGHLRRYVPIQFDPPMPRERQNNTVDAAIAEVDMSEFERKPHWMPVPSGWRIKRAVPVGSLVKKIGRTTQFTTGRVLSISATVDVNYGGGRVARMRDQFITTGISAGGDSGSLVMHLDNNVVGLLFAGSSEVTVCNYIENVRALLRVEVAESIGIFPPLETLSQAAIDRLVRLIGDNGPGVGS